MAQYCRYCVFCFEADDFRCSNHPKKLEPHWTREQINRQNHCPNFELSDLGDVETGMTYQSRKHQPRKLKRNDGQQMKIEIE
jgi:hypothetical protein